MEYLLLTVLGVANLVVIAKMSYDIHRLRRVVWAHEQTIDRMTDWAGEVTNTLNRAKVVRVAGTQEQDSGFPEPESQTLN